MIKIFGDSHSVYFQNIHHTFDNSKIHDQRIETYMTPGASIKGIGKRRNSSLNLQEKLLNTIEDGDLIVLVFGQVDIELGLYYRQAVQQINETSDDFIKSCIESYEYLLNVLKDHFPKSIIFIKGINMPVLIDQQKALRYTKRIITENISDKIQIQKATQRLRKKLPTIIERIKISLQFNDYLEQLALKKDIYYFSVNDLICHSNMMVQDAYIPTGFNHHIIDSIEVRRIHYKSLKNAMDKIHDL